MPSCSPCFSSACSSQLIKLAGLQPFGDPFNYQRCVVFSCAVEQIVGPKRFRRIFILIALPCGVSSACWRPNRLRRTELERFSPLLEENEHFGVAGQEKVAKIVQCGESRISRK